jgi:hypothetical protein
MDGPFPYDIWIVNDLPFANDPVLTGVFSRNALTEPDPLKNEAVVLGQAQNLQGFSFGLRQIALAHVHFTDQLAKPHALPAFRPFGLLRRKNTWRIARCTNDSVVLGSCLALLHSFG